MATIRDVAEACGVSPATVSFVLNDGPRPVSAATRARIVEAMERLNYHPNAAARGLARRRMNNIGVLFSDVETSVVTNVYIADILSGVFREAARHTLDVLIITRQWRDADHSAAPLRDRRSDGFLLIAPQIGSDIVTEIASLGQPLMTVAGLPTGKSSPVSCVDVDNENGAQQATEYLLSLGHRRIAHITGTLTHHSAIARREGFRRTLMAANCPVPEEYIAIGEYAAYYPEPVTSAVLGLLSLPEPPTAIFCANDGIGRMASAIAGERGVRIPEDLSLIGFDDLPEASTTNPPLTTLRQPLRQIGETAARLLIQNIAGETTEPEYRLLKPELIVRGSTAPPKRGG